jgi:IS1 family transposase
MVMDERPDACPACRGRLIDWKCGDRAQATLDPLLERLERWGMRLFGTDDDAPNDAALSVGGHEIGRDETQRSESNNACERHWFARCRQRTWVVSRSVEMVEVTMTLFAYYPCNSSSLTPTLVG